MRLTLPLQLEGELCQEAIGMRQGFKLGGVAASASGYLEGPREQ